MTPVPFCRTIKRRSSDSWLLSTGHCCDFNACTLAFRSPCERAGYRPCERIRVRTERSLSSDLVPTRRRAAPSDTDPKGNAGCSPGIALVRTFKACQTECSRSWNANTLSQRFYWTYRNAGIVDASSHSGRRTFITTLAKKGVGGAGAGGTGWAFLDHHNARLYRR